MAAEDTITEAELAEYYKRHDSSSLAAETAVAMAARIFADVEANREPEYEPGQVYESPGGGHWRRTPDGMWEVFGSEGRFSHNSPKRPLRRLVPLPAREDLLAALEESLDREHGYEGQARRVLKLLEGDRG